MKYIFLASSLSLLGCTVVLTLDNVKLKRKLELACDLTQYYGSVIERERIIPDDFDMIAYYTIRDEFERL